MSPRCDLCTERIPDECRGICPACRREAAELADARNAEWWS